MPKPRQLPEGNILNDVFKKISRTKLADLLHISRAAISQWKRVPDDHVREVAAATGISLKRLRPDLYDKDHKAESEAAAVPA